MDFLVKQGSLIEQPCDVLIVNLFQGVKAPGGGTGAVDKALGGVISETIRDEEFEGRLGEILVIRGCGTIPAKKVLVVGLGKREEFGIRQIMQAAGAAGRKCREMRAVSVASILHGAGIGGLDAFDCAKAVVLGTILGTYEFTRLKTLNVKDNSIREFCIVELSPEKLNSIEKGIEHARVLGDAITFARDLANEPSNVVTPTYLADLAEQIAAETGMRCRIKDRKAIEESRMGLLAAVARGASVEPRFIEIVYESPNAQRKVAIVGKGITFDTGGHSLKSADAMYGMKDDMSGAAAVLATMRAIGRLKPKINVVGLIPATENAISENAIHPGDVFTSYSGKTVEINNTDAEGRLILADAVSYAVTLGVDEIVDVATLTGACVIALGRDIAGIFGNDRNLVDRLLRAGASCGEQLWELPLYLDYKEDLKSEVADIRNNASREAAAINGALFIESFVEGVPWAHIDLSSAMVDKDTYLAKKGCTGAGTGTLIEYLLKS
jgi:leucyl aminopeptidase